MKNILNKFFIISIVSVILYSCEQEVKTKTFYDSILVKAGYAKNMTIIVPKDFKDIHLIGNFITEGGSGNDVYVYLMSEEEYLNYANGHNYNVIYSSGKATTKSFNIPIPNPGNYILVLDNKFSLFSDKLVRISLDMTYKTNIIKRILGDKRNVNPNIVY